MSFSFPFSLTLSLVARSFAGDCVRRYTAQRKRRSECTSCVCKSVYSVVEMIILCDGVDATLRNINNEMKTMPSKRTKLKWWKKVNFLFCLMPTLASVAKICRNDSMTRKSHSQSTHTHIRVTHDTIEKKKKAKNWTKIIFMSFVVVHLHLRNFPPFRWHSQSLKSTSCRFVMPICHHPAFGNVLFVVRKNIFFVCDFRKSA